MRTIVLGATTQSLEIKLAGAVTTNQLDWTASRCDSTSTTLTEGVTTGTTNNTSDVTIVAAPGASTKRVVKSITVYNADTVNATIIISYNDNGSKRIILRKTLGTLTSFASDDGPPVNNIKTTEIDFGSTPVYDKSFTITDGSVSADQYIVCSVSYEAPTGKDQDELEMDDLQLRAVAGTGSFTLFVKSADSSYLHDKFKINYFNY